MSERMAYLVSSADGGEEMYTDLWSLLTFVLSGTRGPRDVVELTTTHVDEYGERMRYQIERGTEEAIFRKFNGVEEFTVVEANKLGVVDGWVLTEDGEIRGLPIRPGGSSLEDHEARGLVYKLACAGSKVYRQVVELSQQLRKPAGTWIRTDKAAQAERQRLADVDPNPDSEDVPYVYEVPCTEDQGPCTLVGRYSYLQTARQDALQQYNGMRAHDGQPPLEELPEGTRTMKMPVNYWGPAVANNWAGGE